MNQLIVKDLHKNFGKKQVVRGVDFSMSTGEVLGLLGPNGAGKTTTFYMIVGFYKPNHGNVFIDDKNITKLPMYKRAKLGISYLPKNHLYLKNLQLKKIFGPFLKTDQN